MDLVWWIIALGALIGHFPAGYLGARMINCAEGLAELKWTWRTLLRFNQAWNTTVDTSFGKDVFGLSVMLGWLTLVLGFVYLTLRLWVILMTALFATLPQIARLFKDLAP